MTQGKNNHVLVQDSWFQFKDNVMINNQDGDSRKCTPSSSSSSIGEESTVSNGSSISSSDTTDDASSPSTNCGRALYDLSEIMSQLPIKRGLSKFYEGKSESFTSLSRVKTIEDLAKNANPYRRKLKASKSCGNGLSCGYKPYTLPRPIITKKTTRGTCLASALASKKGSFLMCSKPPVNPLHKNF